MSPSRRMFAVLILVALLAATAFAETIVSDTIRTTTWTKAGSPYRLDGSVSVEFVVPAGETLTIEPGVNVIVGSYLGLIVKGRLVADGADFVPDYQSWSGIEFGGHDSSIIRNSSIAHMLDWGVVIGESASVAFENVVFDGMYSEDVDMVRIGTTQNVSFDSCTFTGGIWSPMYPGRYVAAAGHVTFTGCTFTGGVWGGGISIHRGVTLRRCLIAGNATDFAIRIGGGSVELDHVTIAGNTSAQYISYESAVVVRSGATAIIRNSIIADNVITGDATVTYSLVKGGYSGEGNTAADPMFVDPGNGDYRLREDSPAIDAGDPRSLLDPDGSRTDMGAYPSSYGVPVAFGDASAPPVFSLSPNAPNPFNPSTTIRFSLTQPGEARLTICDVNGRLVRTLVSGPIAAGTHEAVWDGTDAAGRRGGSGVYVYRLTAREGVLVQRMALVR